MFARSEQDWADVAAETSGFVLRAGCFYEFVQFLLSNFSLTLCARTASNTCMIGSRVSQITNGVFGP